MKPAPFDDWHKDSGLGTALGYQLRAMGEAGFKEFAEACFGILYRPGFHYVALKPVI